MPDHWKTEGKTNWLQMTLLCFSDSETHKLLLQTYYTLANYIFPQRCKITFSIVISKCSNKGWTINPIQSKTTIWRFFFFLNANHWEIPLTSHQPVEERKSLDNMGSMGSTTIIHVITTVWSKIKDEKQGLFWSKSTNYYLHLKVQKLLYTRCTNSCKTVESEWNRMRFLKMPWL